MSLTLKIATGVFLGAIAAFVAVSLPGWIGSYITQKHEFEKIQKDGEARQVIRGLTPDIAIQRCGNPQKDVIDKGIDTRYLYYASQSVVLMFLRREDGPWVLESMVHGALHNTGGNYFPDGTPVQGDGSQGKLKAFDKAAPCLELK